MVLVRTLRDLLVYLGARVLGPVLLVLLAASFALGCTPNVGDPCQLSTDCGSTGQLVCDTSESGGYCTLVDCLSDGCPDNAGCIEFYPSVPGCGYNDHVPSRLNQPFCMATCSSNSDCRIDYICASPTQSPWFALILDDNQQELVCLPLPPTSPIGGMSHPDIDPDAAVCQASAPAFDANFPPYESGFTPDVLESSVGESGGADAPHKGD